MSGRGQARDEDWLISIRRAKQSANSREVWANFEVGKFDGRCEERVCRSRQV